MYVRPEVHFGSTFHIAEFDARVLEICNLGTRHGPVPTVVADRVVEALYKFESGYHWHGPKRNYRRIAILVVVRDIVRQVEEGTGFPFAVSDGRNDGTIRHCRNGQFLRALLTSCQLDQRTQQHIPAQLAQLVDAARNLNIQSV